MTQHNILQHTTYYDVLQVSEDDAEKTHMSKTIKQRTHRDITNNDIYIYTQL